MYVFAPFYVFSVYWCMYVQCLYKTYVDVFMNTKYKLVNSHCLFLFCFVYVFYLMSVGVINTQNKIKVNLNKINIFKNLNSLLLLFISATLSFITFVIFIFSSPDVLK